MALEEPRKLNVGRNRSAGAVLDEQLMREALEALEILLFERDTFLDDDDPVWPLDPAFDIARNAATLLEERLLKE